tara:strand:- start:172 stop:312 length:141 start_codon:yes stop_codon:yes gene_type:complete
MILGLTNNKFASNVNYSLTSNIEVIQQAGIFDSHMLAITGIQECQR